MSDSWEDCVGPGWAHLVKVVVRQAEKENVRIRQVKEKWGGLRIYTDPGPAYLEGMIATAETRSHKICEFCGAPGHQVSLRGWLKTACDTCHKKRLTELKG